MKYADINKRFTEIVAEYIAKGYVIHTTTMGGSQGETAKVDLTNGKEVIRVMLDTNYERDELYYNTVRLSIGRCKDKIKINKNGLHDIIWNGHLEIISVEKFYQIGEYDSSFFGTIDDVRSRYKKHKERLSAGLPEEGSFNASVKLNDAARKIVLPCIKRKKGYKSTRLSDIREVRKFIYESHNEYYAFIDGKKYGKGRVRIA